MATELHKSPIFGTGKEQTVGTVFGHKLDAGGRKDMHVRLHILRMRLQQRKDTNAATTGKGGDKGGSREQAEGDGKGGNAAGCADILGQR